MEVVRPTVVSLREAVARVVGELSAPITRAELVRRVSALHPSHARRPDDLILAEVRRHTRLVRLDDGRFAPPSWVLRGVQFRYVPTAQEAAAGLLPRFPCFTPFCPPGNGITPAEGAPALTLRDGKTGETIAWRPFDLRGGAPGAEAGEGAIQFQAVSLRPWLTAQGFAAGDSLLLTIEGPQQGVFSLRHEPAAEADRAAIAIQDATLESVLLALVEKDSSEQPFVEDIIPAALARLHAAARKYPGSHWSQVVAQSPRLRLVDDYAIARASFRRPIDRLFGYAATAATERNLEQRVDAFDADLRRVLAAVGARPDETAPDRPRYGQEEALRRCAEQIAEFLMHEGSGEITEERYRCLALPSVYLAKHEGVSLADADFDMLARFLLSYYPRRVLFHRKTFTSRMLASLRRFYAHQSAEEHSPTAALPHRLSRLHALVDRKIALAAEIDPASPQSARLFAKLFPDVDKDDAEVVTVTPHPEPPAPD